jgi:acyl-CoA reductase-like NAD-dependent aldehyde dehydrogenase
VLKPSEHTPLQGVLEEILGAAGFPAEAIQIVQGGGAVGERLIDAGPDLIFFTGSESTGRKILARAAENLIPVTLELGGKDPMIVFADANLERATAGALWGGVTNSGQSCTSVERVYVEESIYSAFRDRLLVRARALQPGRDYGHITTSFQVSKILSQLEDARKRGATVTICGEWDGRSAIIPPIIVEKLSEDAPLWTEETFGPLLPLAAFRDEDDAVARANHSPYGLSASVWSRDNERALRVARRLEVGNVSCNNVMLTEGNPWLPFGGVKRSGFGRIKGEEGLRGFCNVKSVLVDADGPKIEAHWYPYTDEKLALFHRLTLAAFGKGIRALLRFVLTGLKLESLAKRGERA